MASIEGQIEGITDEINQKEGKIELLWEQRRASNDASMKAELLEQIQFEDAARDKLNQVRLVLQRQLPG